MAVTSSWENHHYVVQMADTSPKAIPLLVVRGLIRSAYCSACGDSLPVETNLSPEEQQAKLEEALKRHVRARHEEGL